MLEFNQEHKSADLSSIKLKTDRAKNAGKVVLCGIALSAVLLLSGCVNNNSVTSEQPIITSTAIIMENGNAMIVDLQSYRKMGDSTITDEGVLSLQRLALTTTDGDVLIVDSDINRSLKIVDGENSHEKAEMIAQSLISENGRITCYGEEESHNKTR